MGTSRKAKLELNISLSFKYNIARMSSDSLVDVAVYVDKKNFAEMLFYFFAVQHLMITSFDETAVKSKYETG